jgi:hypothetical protein
MPTNVAEAVTIYGNEVGYIFNTSPFYMSLGFSFHHAPRFGKIGFHKRAMVSNLIFSNEFFTLASINYDGIAYSKFDATNDLLFLDGTG